MDKAYGDLALLKHLKIVKYPWSAPFKRQERQNTGSANVVAAVAAAVSRIGG
jgi:hypothetical protein